MKHPTVTRLLCTLLAICLLCGGLVACSKESEIPDGYQYATCNGEYFLLFVPTQWTVNTESGVSGGCYSLLEGTAVSMTEVPFDKPSVEGEEDTAATLTDFFNAHMAEIATLKDYKAEKVVVCQNDSLYVVHSVSEELSEHDGVQATSLHHFVYESVPGSPICIINFF